MPSYQWIYIATHATGLRDVFRVDYDASLRLFNPTLCYAKQRLAVRVFGTRDTASVALGMIGESCEFTVEPLPDGAWDISVRHPGYEPQFPCVLKRVVEEVFDE